MLSLRAQKTSFRLILPKDFICPEIEEKYSEILRTKKSFFETPIDFLNETIQKVQVLGFDNATFVDQQQSSTGYPLIDPTRIKENQFMYPSGEAPYRAPQSPINLIDRTLNITFRHTMGYLSYFMLFENFWYQYSRDRSYTDIRYEFCIDILNEIGEIYSRILLQTPIIHSMDMLDLDFTQPIAAYESFSVVFKYSNFDFQFIDIKPDEEFSEVYDIHND